MKHNILEDKPICINPFDSEECSGDIILRSVDIGISIPCCDKHNECYKMMFELIGSGYDKDNLIQMTYPMLCNLLEEKK